MARSKAVLAVILALCMAFTGCSVNWVQIALTDLPVLIQIATSIAGLVSVVGSGQSTPPAELQAIQTISSQAQADLTLIQTLYSDYKQSPSTTTLSKIQAAIADAQMNLPAILQATHISDPILSSRITAAVNLVLTTIAAFAALIPSNTTLPVTAKKLPVPTASDLKKAWAQQVCAGDATCTAMVK